MLPFSPPWKKFGVSRTIVVTSFVIILACVIFDLFGQSRHTKFSPTPMSSNGLIFAKKPDVLPNRDTLSRLQQEHERRQNTIQDFCASRSPNHTLGPDNLRDFSFSDRHTLVYCAIPKVGTSFLLRVMKLMNGELPRGKFFGATFLHPGGGIKGYYSFRGKSPTELEKLLRSYKKFLFVRDPYSRLFSAFMDKVFLPGRRTRAIAGASQSQSRLMGGEDETETETGSGPLCSLLNVTFETFLRAITVGGKRDAHWFPMHQHCRPCSVRFDYVGKLETFMEDAQFILNQVGVSLDNLTSNVDSMKSDTDLTFLKDVADRTFGAAERQSCSSKTYLCQVMQKVWIVLQTRGMLSKYIPYPFPTKKCDSMNKTDFVQRLVNLYHSQPGSRAERRSQRKEAMMEAYYSLPRWLLRKVEEYVDADCALFGYDCSVDTRFPLDNPKLLKEYFRQFG